MEDIKQTKIGIKEIEKLKPAKVTIVDTLVSEVGEKKNKKLICYVKHPQKEEPIQISTLTYVKKTNVITQGLWVNLDEDKNIQKGSGLAVLLNHLGCETIADLDLKECETVEDDSGYLCFKAY